MSQGIEPDLEEGLSKEEKKKLNKERKARERAQKRAGELESIEQKFNSSLKAEPMYSPKIDPKSVLGGG